jgi:DNA-binding response OmpR family regulator
MDTILIVDDEKNIADLIELYAKQAGYRVTRAYDGEAALTAALSDPPDVIVLDLMLPKLDGWEVCKRVRAKSDVPIIMLTARDDDLDKIVGLELGADDYLTKPFNPRELIARVKAVLRRRESRSDVKGNAVYRVGQLTLDPARREVWAADQPVKLRAKEFDLLETLMQHRGIVFTRERLLEVVWGFDFAGETRTVDVHIAQLRKRIGGCGAEIETVFGVGYKLVESPAKA